MSFAPTPDGERLHFADHGTGEPILFLHEFAGDARSWKPQVDVLDTPWRCITYNARGYPPSSVPDRGEAYSQSLAASDALAILNACGLDRAHLVGLSMGAFCALHVALRARERVASLTIAGCGYGSAPADKDPFRSESRALAGTIEERGMVFAADEYSRGPARVQLKQKAPATWTEFRQRLGDHDPVGAAGTLRGVQAARPSLFDLTEELAALAVGALIIAGEEDRACLEASLMLERTIPGAELILMPGTGHTCNLEEPEAFNAAVTAFLDRNPLGGEPRAHSQS